MFQSAKLKLTLIYSLIILLISGTLGVLIYLRTSKVIDQEFAQIEHRLQMEREQFFPRSGVVVKILPEEIHRAKQNIVWQLLIVNGTIVAMFAIAGYYLSGRTLKPIQKAMDEQKRFVGDAAHELQTPPTALKTSMEVNLMDNKLPKKAKDILMENLEDLNSLESLVQNLLELAKHEDNALVFNSVSLSEIIKQAIKHIQPLADQNQIIIKTTDTSKELMIDGNFESLVRLLIVFLDNAIKYSSAGSPITVSLTSRSGFVWIRIKDSGMGIDKHHLPYIFDRFYRVDPSRKKGGYGLGLSVAKKIVELHHGSISVDSEVGKGTAFTIQLPIKQPSLSI